MTEAQSKAIMHLLANMVELGHTPTSHETYSIPNPRAIEFTVSDETGRKLTYVITSHGGTIQFRDNMKSNDAYLQIDQKLLRTYDPKIGGQYEIVH